MVGPVIDARTIRLKRDPIRDAVCELRFESSEQAEIVAGRLADGWKGQPQSRLPAADIPAPIRLMEPSLRFQPIFQIGDSAGIFSRIGPNSVAVHHTPPYSDWNVYRPNIKHAVEALFRQVPDAKVTRIGLRYINGPNATDHHIGKSSDLLLSISAGGKPVVNSFALNFRRRPSKDHVCQINVSSPDYVVAPPGEEFAMLIDVDVFTPEGHVGNDANGCLDWIDRAHDYLKEEFFALWPAELLERLKQ